MKNLILILMLMAHLYLFSQPYVGVSYVGKSAGFHAGMVAEKIDVNVFYKTPFLRRSRSTITSFNAGKQFLLTKKEEDNWSITPSIGFANYKYEDFSTYNTKMNIVKVTEIQPMYRLEFSKDANLGQVFMSAIYCKEAYYEVGFKAFLYKTKNN